jgi:hypothetical protein
VALDLRGSDLRGSLIGLICVALDLHRSFACGSDLRVALICVALIGVALIGVALICVRLICVWL